MFHSVTINGKNTWDNYHMVPANGIYLPTPPEQKRTTIDLKTGNGLLDVSTVLTGYPLFQNRSGELQYFILDPWDLEEQGIGSSLNLNQVEQRIKKHFSEPDSNKYITNFFNRLRNLVYDDTTSPEYFVTVVYGINETQTAISAVDVGFGGNKIFVDGDGRIKEGVIGTSSYGYIVTNGTFLGHNYFGNGSSGSINYSSSDWLAPFSFSNVPSSGSTSSTSTLAYNAFPNVTNVTYNGSNGMTSWISANVYANSSSTEIVYGKNFYKTKLPSAIHSMPNAYDVYSQILNDIHGQTGTMIFEDDPYWYYQGNFTVKSMDTNSVRRGVVIGYDVAPYKLRTSTSSISINSQDASTWVSSTISANNMGDMPINPIITVSGTFNAETVSLQFCKLDGTVIAEKTIGNTVSNITYPDVVLYKGAIIKFKGSSGKTATITWRPGRL